MISAPATITTSSTKPFTRTLEGEAGGNRIVVHPIAGQPGRRHLGRLLLAWLEQTFGYAAEHRQIADKPLADGLCVAAGPFALPGVTSLRQRRVQRRERGRMRQRGHEGALGILYQPLHLPFVVALARPAEAVPEQEMADQFGVGTRAGTPAIAQDARP